MDMELDKIELLSDQKAKVEKYKEFLERSVSSGSNQNVKTLVTHGE